MVNDAPTLDPLPDLTIPRNSGLRIIQLTGITPGPENEAQNLTITAISSNPDLIPNPIVTYASPDAIGTLALAPLPDAAGSSTITVTAQDDGGTASGGQDTISRTFHVTVFAPAFLQISEEAGACRISFLTTIGKSYVLEYVDSLDETSWTPVTTLSGTGDREALTVPVMPGPCRFFRVRFD